MQAARFENKQKECHAPDCRAFVPDLGKKFCPICQARLDRVKAQLEVRLKDATGRRNGRVVMPTVESLNPSTAASFDEGLRRRVNDGQELSQAERVTRAVRIVQMMKAGEKVEAIVSQLSLADGAELESELAMYRDRNTERARKWSGGLKRDISTDKAILEKVKNPRLSRKTIAKELGLTDAALASRLRRLRNEGHQVPDRRHLPRKVREAA